MSEPKLLEAGRAVVVEGNRLPHGYPSEVVTHALELVIGCQSVAEAHRLLEEEMTDAEVTPPTYSSVSLWARQSEECLAALEAGSKREMVGIASDAARAWGGKMVALAGSKAVSDRDTGINYGIAMQRRADWESTGQRATGVAIQFNWKQKD